MKIKDKGHKEIVNSGKRIVMKMITEVGTTILYSLKHTVHLALKDAFSAIVIVHKTTRLTLDTVVYKDRSQPHNEG